MANLSELLNKSLTNKEIKNILIEYAEAYGFDPDRTDNISIHFKEYSSSNKESRKRKSFYNLILYFHFVEGIDLERFFPDESKKEEFEQDPFYRKVKPFERKEIKVSQLKSFVDSNDKVKKKEYLNTSSDFLNHFKKSLEIYDYLDRFSIEKLKKEYVNVHKNIFWEIESKVRDKKLHYSRFLVLPSGTFQMTKEVSSVQSLDELSVSEEVIKFCSVPLFRHICRTLKGNPNFESEDFRDENGEVKSSGGFYLVGYPKVTYHWAIVDEGGYLLTEYYSYNDDNFCKPDLLFVENNKGELSDLSILYSERIKKMYKAEYPKLTLELIGKTISKIDSSKLKNYEKESLELKKEFWASFIN